MECPPSWTATRPYHRGFCASPLAWSYGGGRIAFSHFLELAMRHVLSALVQNVPGVLSHISGMLASRGYNIDSLTVGETENPAAFADDLRGGRRRQRSGAGPQAT